MSPKPRIWSYLHHNSLLYAITHQWHNDWWDLISLSEIKPPAILWEHFMVGEILLRVFLTTAIGLNLLRQLWFGDLLPPFTFVISDSCLLLCNLQRTINIWITGGAAWFKRFPWCIALQPFLVLRILTPRYNALHIDIWMECTCTEAYSVLALQLAMHDIVFPFLRPKFHPSGWAGGSLALLTPNMPFSSSRRWISRGSLDGASLKRECMRGSTQTLCVGIT